MAGNMTWKRRNGSQNLWINTKKFIKDTRRKEHYSMEEKKKTTVRCKNKLNDFYNEKYSFEAYDLPDWKVSLDGLLNHIYCYHSLIPQSGCHFQILSIIPGGWRRSILACCPTGWRHETTQFWPAILSWALKISYLHMRRCEWGNT